MAVTPSQQTCAFCRWWAWNRNGPDYRDLSYGPALLAYMRGECRRHAPERDGENFRYDEAVTSRRWPLVAGSDWCGDYEPAPPPMAEEA